MLGWHISVYRQPDRRVHAATFDSEHGERLAVWQARLHGLDWLDGLVREGRAVALGGNGYPLRYTGQARHLRPPIEGGPPEANERWVREPGDVVTGGWDGRTVVSGALAACGPDEWLLVEAWDES